MSLCVFCARSGFVLIFIHLFVFKFLCGCIFIWLSLFVNVFSFVCSDVRVFIFCQD